MQACKFAKEYQGLNPPTCNGGNGCETCRAKYDSRRRAMAARKAKMNK